MESAKEKVEKYLGITGKALELVSIAVPTGSELERVARKLLDMAERYYRDAQFVYRRGDYLTALASVSYAHAWIDVGIVLGLLKGEDPKIFMVEP